MKYRIKTTGEGLYKFEIQYSILGFKYWSEPFINRHSNIDLAVYDAKRYIRGLNFQPEVVKEGEVE